MTTLGKSLVLVGIMGAGKSTVGRLLAVRFGCAFSDVDPEMERREGLPVREIWEQRGDAYFAQLEEAVLVDFLALPPHVIALGGGTFMRPHIRALVRGHATSIWLKASSTTIIPRIEQGEDRHPETRRHAATEMAGLAEKRDGIYGEAELTIDNNDLTAEQAVEAIIARLSLRPPLAAPPVSG